VIRPRRGGWQVIVYTGIDPVTGRQRQISRQVHGSRKQAERLETQLKAEVLAGRHRGTAAKTLGEMVDVFLQWREQNGKPIGPRTIQGYRALAEARIKPGLGKLRLPQVDPPALDRFYTALRKSGSLRKPGEPLSGSRLRDVHAVISGALGLAARYGWVPYNAAALVRPPAPRGARRSMPSREQAREALQAAERTDPELYLFLRLEATTGCGRVRCARYGGRTSTWRLPRCWLATTWCMPRACPTVMCASAPRAGTGTTDRSR
jgi:integrase